MHYCFKFNYIFTQCKNYTVFKKSLTGYSVHYALHQLVYLKLSDQHYRFDRLLAQLSVFKYQLDLTLTVNVWGYFLKRFCAICNLVWKSCVCRQWNLTIRLTECCKNNIHADKSFAKIFNVIEKHNITPIRHPADFIWIRNRVSCPQHRHLERGLELPFASSYGWIHFPR